MRLNCKKTKLLTFSKNDEAQYHQFKANNESLETADCSAFSSVTLPRAPPSLFIVAEIPLCGAWVAFRQLKKVPEGSGNKQN